MKINGVLSCISFVISLFLGYWVYSLAGTSDNALLAGIISTICFLFPLFVGFCVYYDKSVKNINQRALAIIFFIVVCISQFYFAINGILMPYYVLISGLLWCFYLVIAYAINKALK